MSRGARRAEAQVSTAAARSWLLGGEADRERLADMDRRLRPVRRRTLAVMAGALVLSGRWVGWWTLAPLAVAAGLFALADRRTDAASHPELCLSRLPWCRSPCSTVASDDAPSSSHESRRAASR